MKRRAVALAAIDTPGAFVLQDWLPLVNADVEPMLRRVYASRLWGASWAEWGRHNGFDPDAKYTEPEGRRWHQFRHGPPGG